MPDKSISPYLRRPIRTEDEYRAQRAARHAEAAPPATAHTRKRLAREIRTERAAAAAAAAPRPALSRGTAWRAVWGAIVNTTDLAPRRRRPGR